MSEYKHQLIHTYSRIPKRDNNSQRNLRQEEKCKTHIHTTEVKREPNKTSENKCSFCKRNHQFYKCQSYLTIATLEKFSTVKKALFLPNTVSSKHHATLHDYFPLNQKKGDKGSEKQVKNDNKSTKKEGESTKVNTYKTSKVSERVVLQIVLIKVLKNDGETISTFALLGRGSQSILLREDFAKKVKLKGYSRTINISSKKEIHKVIHKVEVQGYTLSKRMFSITSQTSATNGDNQNTFDYLPDIQIPKICVSEVTVLIGPNGPDVFL